MSWWPLVPEDHRPHWLDCVEARSWGLSRSHMVANRHLLIEVQIEDRIRNLCVSDVVCVFIWDFQVIRGLHDEGLGHSIWVSNEMFLAWLADGEMLIWLLSLRRHTAEARSLVSYSNSALGVVRAAPSLFTQAFVLGCNLCDFHMFVFYKAKATLFAIFDSSVSNAWLPLVLKQSAILERNSDALGHSELVLCDKTLIAAQIIVVIRLILQLLWMLAA